MHPGVSDAGKVNAVGQMPANLFSPWRELCGKSVPGRKQMVLSVKTAANAWYYHQGDAHAGDKDLAEGRWVVAARRPHNERRPTDDEFRTGYLGVFAGEQVKADELDLLLRRSTIKSREMPIFSLKGGSTGHDFTFSVPKSVSILWMMRGRMSRDNEVDTTGRAPIERAQHQAVAAAAELLSAHAIRERVGKGGRILRPAQAAMAAFLHFRCRPAPHKISSESLNESDKQDDVFDVFPDPNLHSHLVVPDLVVSSTLRVHQLPAAKKASSGKKPSAANRASPATAEEQKSRTLKVAYTALYGRWSMALGAWYHATLAYELRGLGLKLKSTGPNGLFALEGFETAWTTGFSARTAGAKGLSPGRPAARDFDRLKEAQTGEAKEVEAAWQRHVARLKVDISRYDAARSIPRQPVVLRAHDIDGIMARLGEADAVLQLQDIHRVIASYLVERGIDAPPTSAMVDEVISHLTPLPASTAYGLAQWSTARNMEQEQQVLGLVRKLSAARFAAADVGPFLAALPRPLHPEQEAAARSIAGQEQIAILTGGPGTGKTSLLEPVVQAYEAQFGQGSVVGAAEGWLQALQLRSRFGIMALSLQSLISRMAAGEPVLKIGRSVLIVDEAGLLSTRRMLELLKLADRFSIKLILLGDTEQLDPIGAGSGLRLAEMAHPPVTLQTIHRQQDGPARDAAASLADLATARRAAADGHDIPENRQKIRSSLSAMAQTLVDAKLWEAFGTRNDAIEAIVERLFLHRKGNGATAPLRALMRSHREAQHLVWRMREKLRDEKCLEGDDLVLDAVTPMGGGYKLRIAVGDHVRFLMRNDEIGVFNGTEGIVTAINEPWLGAQAQVDVKLLPETPDAQGAGDVGRIVRFMPADLSQKGDPRVRLACGYAMTVYGSQGQTFDQLLLLKSSRMSARELAVAITRARSWLQIFEVNTRHAELVKDQGDRRPLIRSILQDLIATERRDRRKSLAQDVTRLPNTPRPEPQAWLWQVMSEGEVTEHFPALAA
jgi:ATP-dependent exoDNAse (exonuclease V) alpha subunit